MNLPGKIKQRTIDNVIDNISNLEDYSKRFAKVAIPLLALVAGTAALASYFDSKRISNIYNKVNSAQVLEVSNPIGARPWDYCRNENPKRTPKGDAFYDACLQRMYSENPGLKEGKYLSTLKATDIDGDGKVSSEH